MKLQPIPRVKSLTPAEFRKNYLKPGIPVIIEDLAKDWVAYQKWNWEVFKQLVGDVEVEVYNNVRAGARILVNGGDGKMKFADYIDTIRKGPSDLRLFLFNIFKHAPELKKDFVWPETFMGGFIKAFPSLFVGGAGSIAHMHYDLDLGQIFHTQFIGRKRVLLFPQSESEKLYKMPLTVESAASFVNWHQNGVDYEKWPALKEAQGYETTLQHGETLFMPTGMWHHMEYLDSGFAMSLRALPHTLGGKFDSIYHLFLMRGLNNLLISARPEWWYHKKRHIAYGRVGQQYTPKGS
ncbi:MAG: cupin-like domain-containing protein [Sphingobacteriales bacterium]|nr:MAG: cupin-like domain-containing protein [Sphingobacteriales bacterium]